MLREMTQPERKQIEMLFDMAKESDKNAGEEIQGRKKDP